MTPVRCAFAGICKTTTMAINLLDVIAGHEENENDLLAGIVFGRVVTVNASQSQ